MTLSFTTHWRDELPDFYTALALSLVQISEPTRRG